MRIDEAIAIVNSGARQLGGPLSRVLYALKSAAMEVAAQKGGITTYIYDRTKPDDPPWEIDPELLMLEGGPYYWDLIEVRLGSRAFHLPVRLAAQYGLVHSLKDKPIAYQRRKSVQTGSCTSKPPTKSEITRATKSIIEWLFKVA